MLIQNLLREMVNKKASDLFIASGKMPCCKIEGQIESFSSDPLTAEAAKNLVYSVMDGHQKNQFESEKEANFAIHDEELGRFRVSAFVARSEIGMVIRRIESQIPTFELLGLSKKLKSLINLKRGLVLIVGSTGSGKSTTLAAMVGYRNRKGSGHIISIEDPIEYIHEHDKCIVTQREVGIDTDSFEIALKNSMRQAPDVIQIGEIRDAKTMQYAVSFSETGHLCLATLHANNANQALDRITHFYPEAFREQLWMDLSLNLKAIVAQQLIPGAREERRCLAQEILINTPVIASLIKKGRFDEIKQFMARENHVGMQSFDQALFALFVKGLITYEAALSHADSANDLRLMIKLAEPSVFPKDGSSFSPGGRSKDNQAWGIQED